MTELSTPSHWPQSCTRTHGFVARESVQTPRLDLGVQSIGYLVPRGDFAAQVHSVFAKSCNLVQGNTLLTICASDCPDGPTTLRLGGAGAADLRTRFSAGESVHSSAGRLRAGRVDLHMQHASIWRPALARPWLASARIDANLHGARKRLAQRRQTHSSIVDREGATAVAALVDATRELDIGRATLALDSLIGWGEGLTPAGDDFLVGMMAALGAFAPSDLRRSPFCNAVGMALRTGSGRTTRVSAHYLCLAAGGHFTEPLVAVRDALLSEDQSQVVDAALARALDIGATSGADTLSGLLDGLGAWLSPHALAQAA